MDRYLGLEQQRIAEMKGQLPNVHKRVHVGGRGINGIQLHHAIRHEIDGAVIGAVRELAVPHVCEVDALAGGNL